MSTAIIAFVCVVCGGLLGIFGSFLFEAAESAQKEKEASLCLDFFYTREKENDTVQEVRFFYKDYLYNSVTLATYFTYRSGFKNKEALRHHIDQACANRDWKFEFTDYEVDYATGLPIEKVEKEIK